MPAIFKTPNRMEDLALFTRHVAGAMNARAPLPEMLRAYARESEGGKLSKAAAHAAERVESGVELSVALEDYPRVFPAAYRRLVRLGEQGRALGGVMAQLADSLEEGLKTYEYFRRAAIYPLIILILLFLDVCFLFTFITPKFQDMYTQLGSSATSVYGSGAMQAASLLSLFNPRNLVIAFGVVLLLPILFLIASVTGLKLRGVGYGRMLLELPLVGTVMRRAETARFANNLSLLLRNHIPLSEALGLLADSSANTYVRAAIQNFAQRFEFGERLSDLVATQPLFPPSMAVMIASAEDQGGLVETLQGLGRFYTERTAHGLTVIREVFEPIMLLLIGLLVALIMLSVYLPIFTIPHLIG
jgi:type II secretory pathway component PulF